MGWVSPTGGSGTDWTDVANAYDENVSSFAYVAAATGWTNYIELTVPPLLCDKIRFNVRAWYGAISVDVDVYYEDAYHDVYQGTDFTDNTWKEKDVIPGSPGQAKVVSKMRVRFNRSISTLVKLYEVDFNQAQSVIPNMMKHYRNMRTK